MSEMITLTIDGKEIKAKDGESVLNIARANGIFIPALCYLTRCSPTLACRLCLVEVDGKRAYSYNAKELNLNFPNLDVDLDGVPRRHVDTITYSFLLESQDQEGKRNYEAQQIVLQGDKIIRAERAQALDGTLDVVLDRSDLGAGKMLDASLAISGQGTGDLYVVLMMPNGQYLSLGETRLVSAIGEVIPFREAINLSAVKTLPLVNLPLPGGLVEGTYTFYAIFVAEKANVYDESNWVSLASSEWTYD
mgnify:CR=1 FL=1